MSVMKHSRIVYPHKDLESRTGLPNNYKVNALEFDRTLAKMIYFGLAVAVNPDPEDYEKLIMFVSEVNNRCHECVHREDPNLCAGCCEFFTEKTEYPSLFWAIDPDIKIIIRGGTVQNVIKNRGVTSIVEIIDYDVDGEDEDHLDCDKAGDPCIVAQY